MSDRVFKVGDKLMRGDDVKAWQQFLYDDFRSRWGIPYELEVDGSYGAATRDATASFMRAWGVGNTANALKYGLRPEWRIKLRNDDRTPEERARSLSQEIKDYRQRLRDRFERIHVCYPVPNMSEDSNGFSSGHDGIDLICPWKQPLLAICDGIVRRADEAGWWGNNPKPSHGHPISDGDGIVIIECTISAGPFQPGLKFGYGHAEHPQVKVGETVRAGQVVAWAGWANWPHTHFMVNDDPPKNGLYRGVGDRDPRRYLDYARRND